MYVISAAPKFVFTIASKGRGHKLRVHEAQLAQIKLKFVPLFAAV